MTPEDNGDKVVSAAMQPVQALVIGTGTGNGGTVQALIHTPPGQPNIIIQVITPLMAIIARAGVVFFQSMSGLVVVGGTTGLIPAHDFVELVAKSANLSFCVVGASVLSSLVTIFSNLEKKFPLLRA